MSKYTVFITYGVTVETDNEDEIVAKAVAKMFSHGEDEVLGSCDSEIEEIDEEPSPYEYTHQLHWKED